VRRRSGTSGNAASSSHRGPRLSERRPRRPSGPPAPDRRSALWGHALGTAGRSIRSDRVPAVPAGRRPALDRPACLRPALVRERPRRADRPRASRRGTSLGCARGRRQPDHEAAPSRVAVAAQACGGPGARSHRRGERAAEPLTVGSPRQPAGRRNAPYPRHRQHRLLRLGLPRLPIRRGLGERVRVRMGPRSGRAPGPDLGAELPRDLGDLRPARRRVREPPAGVPDPARGHEAAPRERGEARVDRRAPRRPRARAGPARHLRSRCSCLLDRSTSRPKRPNRH
jgi:hypothetical protein